MFPSLPTITIRQASHQDISTVTSFMDRAILVHRNLDWQPLIEWVPREPFLLRYENKKLISLFSCAPDPEGVAWIHAFAVDHWSSDIGKIWRSLLEPAIERLKIMQSNLFSVALNDWYNRLLNESGFAVKQNIIVLRWDQGMPSILPLQNGIILRPMDPSDLDQVAELDRKAFDPAWTISRVSMEHVFLSAAHSTVAEMDGLIVGYELSTSSYFSAHLTRLAVSPDFKKANIGYSLTRAMLEFFSSRGIQQITVNTQDDNAASIGLYKKLGFHVTDESFPIYWLEIV